MNVNGIRAAVRRGMTPWLIERAPDLLCLQEVRADDATLHACLGPGWFGVHEEAAAKGRAGVAVLARSAPEQVRNGLAGNGFDGSGRWVEADIRLGGPDSQGSQLVTVISSYVHTGEANTPRQEEKYAFLDAASARLRELNDGERHVVLTGDLNIAHREADLKNWKGNRGKAGFLPEERAWLDRLLADGFVDVLREQYPDQDGPYSWWSWRGKAFDNDSGWRIDYVMATTALAARVSSAVIDRAPSYAERWSDHSPVVVDIELGSPSI